MLPAIINEVDITVNQRDTSATGTAVDADFDEPIGAEIRNTSLSLRGQVNFGVGANGRLIRTRTGDLAESSGHVLFRKADLDDAGVTIGKGDRISSIAGVAFDLEIIEVRHQAPLNGAFLLTICRFKERSDVRQSF